LDHEKKNGVCDIKDEFSDCQKKEDFDCLVKRVCFSWMVWMWWM